MIKLTNHRWETLIKGENERYVANAEYNGNTLLLCKDKDILGTSHVREILSRIATNELMGAQGSYVSVQEMGDNHIVLSNLWYDDYNECHHSSSSIYVVDDNLDVFSTILV